MSMERLLKVATPPDAATEVVPLSAPREGLVPMAMPIEAVLFATNLLPESRTLTVTAGLIEAPAALFVGCCKKAKWFAAPNTINVPVPDVAPPWQPLPAEALTVKVYVPGGVAPVVLIWSVAVCGVLVGFPASVTVAGGGGVPFQPAAAPVGSPVTLKVVLQVVLFPLKVTLTR